jgi:DNA (cytosine-5)-methyltransferase 1
VCGFPCQSFSQAGSRGGLLDSRGNIIYVCLDTIKAKRPRYFILENVKNILSLNKKDRKEKYGEVWKIIWSEIQKLEMLGYFVDWRVLNTRDYGIPQNRERLYIVGTMDGKYSWPTMCKMNSIEKYIDNEDAVKSITRSDRARLQNGRSVNKDAVFIDIGFVKYSAYPTADKYAPCITARTELYSFRKKRYANVKEYLMLQGFPTTFKQVVSNNQMKKQIGNSMSVNVLKKLIQNLMA